MTTKIAFSRMALSEKIPPGSPLWSEFNASFNNMDLEAIDIINLIYQGHPFTTWHKDHWRHSKNYQLGMHVGMDFDTEDKRSTLAHLSSDKFIQRYANVIYTTPSHTPEAPRARVLFLLDAPIHQAQNYTLAVSALLWLFGNADRQCKDAVRFFYGSVSCEVEYIDQKLPLTVVKDLIGRYKATGAGTKRKHENRNFTAPTDQERVATALKYIPAMGIEYDQWVAVLMGIHSEYGDNGLALAESWAQGTPNEVTRKWRSFNRNGNGAGTVSLGTVFKLAKDFGWQGSAL